MGHLELEVVEVLVVLVALREVGLHVDDGGVVVASLELGQRYLGVLVVRHALLLELVVELLGLGELFGDELALVPLLADLDSLFIYFLELWSISSEGTHLFAVGLGLLLRGLVNLFLEGNAERDEGLGGVGKLLLDAVGLRHLALLLLVGLLTCDQRSVELLVLLGHVLHRPVRVLSQGIAINKK